MPTLHPHRSEFSYLREQRTHALNEIQETLASLGAAVAEGADPRRWARTNPWATAGTAFGLGLAAGYVVTPAKQIPTRSGQDTASAQAAAHLEPVQAGPAMESPATGVPGDSPGFLSDKLASGAKSLVVGAVYGLGRLALNQILDGLLAGIQPPSDPAAQGPDYAADHHAESFAWQPETPA